MPMLEVMADFCLAVDKFMNIPKDGPVRYLRQFFSARISRLIAETSLDDPRRLLERFFRKEVLCDLRNGDSLKTAVRVSVGKSRLPGLKGVNLAKIRLFYGLGSIPYNIHRRLWEQELKLTKAEIYDFIVGRWGEDTFHDCINHFLYGESYNDIGYFRNVSKQRIHIKLNEVWDEVKKMFGNQPKKEVKGESKDK